MPKNDNKPRLDQYRVGSILEYNIGLEHRLNGYYHILRIDKLKNVPMTYAVHMWKIGDPEPISIDQTHWNGAHQINEMLDSGDMKVVSY